LLAARLCLSVEFGKKTKIGEIDHTNADLRQYLTIENGDLTIENEDSKKENDRSTIPINPHQSPVPLNQQDITSAQGRTINSGPM